MSIYNDVFLIDEQLREMQEQAQNPEATEDERVKILEQAREFVLNQGLETLSKIYTNREAEIKAYKEEEQRLAARRKSLENYNDGLKEYMKECFKLTGEQKGQYGTFTLSWRKSTQCVIDESIFNDERFTTIEEVKHIDKMKVKKCLVDGEVIAGATLVENQNLQIK